MARKVISVAVDPEQILKGDVIIIKRTFFDPNVPGKLRTNCTKCGCLFDTQLRRMVNLDSKNERRCEVRNVPQCPACRSKKVKPAEATQPIPPPDLRAIEADHVRAIEAAENEGMPS
jgi:hypothetical protein